MDWNNLEFLVIIKAIHRLAFTASILFLLAGIFFAWKQVQEHRILSSFLNELEIEDGLSTDEFVVAMSDEIYDETNDTCPLNELSLYDRFEAESPANITTAVSLQYEIYVTDGHAKNGPCGTMSRTLLNALWRNDIRARKLHLQMPDGSGHTMVEYADGDKWKVIAPSDLSFVWKNAADEIASVKEIQQSDEVFSQIYAVRPDYAYSFKHANHFNWDRLPGFIHDQALSRWGQQWCDDFETPWLMDQPRLLLCMLSMIAFAFTFIIARLSKRVLRRRASGDVAEA